MTFTEAQTTAFFQGADQMALNERTRGRLAVEGLETVQDLVEFDDDSFKQLVENLRKPGGMVENPDPNAPEGAMIPTPPFVLSAKSHARLKVAMKAAKYYEMVSRPLTPQNMSWSPCLKDFAEHWDALTQCKENEDPQVPKITKTLQVMQWAEAFSDFLHRKVGIRSIPLAYVTRPEIAVAEPAPPLAENRSYSTGDDGHGSVEGELIARASHSHAKFRDDNASVYYFVEEATRGTTYRRCS
jgi:hypothetical protein